MLSVCITEIQFQFRIGLLTVLSVDRVCIHTYAQTYVRQIVDMEIGLCVCDIRLDKFANLWSVVQTKKTELMYIDCTLVDRIVDRYVNFYDRSMVCRTK